MYRRQIESIAKDLNKKIVFIVGPRQVGKTWLARETGKLFKDTVYLVAEAVVKHDLKRKEYLSVMDSSSWGKIKK